MRYRTNYGQGQVGPTTTRAAATLEAERVGRPSYVERYHPGDAEDPGEWWPVAYTDDNVWTLRELAKSPDMWTP